MKKRNFQKINGIRPVTSSRMESRVELLPEETRDFVRGGQIIGSVYRALEELVRNAVLHGKALEVNVTIGHSTNSITGTRITRTTLTVSDDGIGIEEAAVRDLIGTHHCTSTKPNSQSIPVQYQEESSHRGESLKALAALSIEFQIQSTRANLKKRNDNYRGLTSAPSKAKRSSQTSFNNSIPTLNDIESFTSCEKLIRNSKVISFQSKLYSVDSNIKSGTSITLSGLFHKHHVRLRQFQLQNEQKGNDPQYHLRIGQVRSCLQELAFAFPHVTVRLFVQNELNCKPDAVWLQTLPWERSIILESLNLGVDSYRSFCQLLRQRCARFDCVLGGGTCLDLQTCNGRLELGSYSEGVKNRNGVNSTSTFSSSFHGRIARSTRYASIQDWQVCGVLIYKEEKFDESEEALATTNRSRQQEFVFLNNRPLKNHSSITDKIQKDLKKCSTNAAFYSWSFLIHIICPSNAVDLVVDEWKSYSRIRDKDRLSRCIADAIANCLTENGLGCELNPNVETKDATFKEVKYKKGENASASLTTCNETNKENMSIPSSKPVMKENAMDDKLFVDAFFSEPIKTDPVFLPSLKRPSKVKSSTEEPDALKWTKSKLKSIQQEIKSVTESASQSEVKITKEMLSRARFIAQLDSKFLIVEMDGFLCIIDQHAAGERVGLERIEKAVEKCLSSSEKNEETIFSLSKLKNVNMRNLFKSKSLSPPKSLTLTHTQNETVSRHGTILRKYHYEFDHDPSTNMLQLKGFLQFGEKVSTEKDFLQFVQILSSGGASLTKPSFLKRCMASYACRYAIMFGDTLSDTECKELLKSLAGCNHPFSCAHGRPSFIPLANLEVLDTTVASNTSTIVPLRFQKKSVRVEKRKLQKTL